MADKTQPSLPSVLEACVPWCIVRNPFANRMTLAATDAVDPTVNA
jgi:hypothetical protein